MQKLFGGINLTWKKLIIFALIAGVYTGVMAMLPAAEGTSFEDITITFEWWILFGILVIVNSKSPLDSGLKCIVFFLISQPLVYLVQVPFTQMGWGLFGYYPPWFVWTLFTFPMGFIGWYMKKDKWWGMLILGPMLLFLGYHYMNFLGQFRMDFPHHLLSMIFCAVTMIIYPWYIFKDKKIRLGGVIFSLAILIAATILSFTIGTRTYDTILLVNNGSLGAEFDDTYVPSLEDEKMGEVEVIFDENIEDYMIRASFKRTGDTKLILTSPDGEKRVFDLTVYEHRYDIKESSE